MYNIIIEYNLRLLGFLSKRAQTFFRENSPSNFLIIYLYTVQTTFIDIFNDINYQRVHLISKNLNNQHSTF